MLKKHCLFKLLITPLLLLFAATTSAHSVTAVIINNVTGEPLRQSAVTVIELTENQIIDVVNTNFQGIVRLQLPGLDEGHRVYQLQVENPLNGRPTRSPPITQSGRVAFLINGGWQVRLMAINHLTKKPLAGVLINAYERLPNQRLRFITRQQTDSQGQSVFQLPHLKHGWEHVFSTRPYLPHQPTEVFSASIDQPGELMFELGKVAVTFVDGDTHQPLVGKQLWVYEQQPDGSLQRFVLARTDDQGQVFFDLPGLSEGQSYLIGSLYPFGFEGQKQYYSPPITQEGHLTWTIYRQGEKTLTVAEQQLLNRITFGATPTLWHQLQQQGASVFLTQQLHPETIDDGAFQARIADFELNRDADLALWLLWHALYSQRQLQEVMTQFWDNHFSTDITQTRLHSELNENQGFRAHALGYFRDLLQVSATSAAMLVYLNNADSRQQAPNENYARELMELHTLGVDGGYSEQDVAEVARVFTGWSVNGSEFVFKDRWHDKGEKMVLGQVIPAGGGMEEGHFVLDMLAQHPATAHFICTKLLQLFVNDQPAVSDQAQCAQTFLETQGNIRQMVAQILTSEAFTAVNQLQSKTKTPLEFITTFLRNFEATTPLPDRVLNRALANMGMPLFANPIPTGWSELGRDWISSYQIMQRIRFVNQVIFNDNAARVQVDLKALFLKQGYKTAEEIVDFLLAFALAEDYSLTEWQLALEILSPEGQPFDIHAASAEQQLRVLVSTVLSFPSYQLQ